MDRDLAAKAGASMSHEKRKEVSSKGGRSLPPEKRIFAKNPEFAAECGKKSAKIRNSAKRPFDQRDDVASQAEANGREVPNETRS